MPNVFRADLHKLAKFTNIAIAVLPVLLFALGYFVSFYFHFLTVAALFRTNVFPDWITVDGGEETSAAKNPPRD